MPFAGRQILKRIKSKKNKTKHIKLSASSFTYYKIENKEYWFVVSFTGTKILENVSPQNNKNLYT